MQTFRTNSTMSLAAANQIVNEITKQFGYTNIKYERIGGEVKFVILEIRLKVGD